MAYVEPNSTIYLLRVPIDPTYENTLSWPPARRDLQEDYFLYGTAVERYVLTEYSYIRKMRNVIKVEGPVGAFRTYNYMAFKNTDFENKWFYAFITNVDYINNITCEIHFELDLIQTYYFDTKFNECFIERQHSATDNIGDNLIDEGLETGEYIINKQQDYHTTPVAVMAVTMEYDATDNKFVPVDGGTHASMGAYSTYYHGCAFRIYGIADPNTAATEITRLNNDIALYTEKNKINAIVSLFIAPGEIFASSSIGDFDPINENVKITVGNVNGYFIDGYTPKNKKLLTFPYNFLQVSNYQGDAVDYKYEYFSNPENIVFNRYGNYTPNPGVLLIPSNYKGADANWEEIVINQCYPICSYNNDTYKAWLAQNKGVLTAGAFGVGAGLAISGVQTAGGIGTAAASALTGNVQGVVGGIKQAVQGLPNMVGSIIAGATLLGRVYDHSTLPTTQHGNGNGDLMYSMGRGGFGVYHKSITQQFARRIDMFFSMYGYKQGIAGIPNRLVRQKWTYVKTAGCSIHGNIPCDDIRNMEKIYDKGIRFWTQSGLDQNGDFVSFETANDPIT